MGSETDKDMCAKHDLHTLIEAEKIRKDDDRYKAAMKKRREMMDALKEVKREEY